MYLFAAAVPCQKRAENHVYGITAPFFRLCDNISLGVVEYFFGVKWPKQPEKQTGQDVSVIFLQIRVSKETERQDTAVIPEQFDQY